MEQIIYRKTLDVHKNGTQFLLQGFETADKLSRIIEISLMASGDAIDFPLEGLVAMMHVTSPGATEASINPCEIKDNKVIYNVLPITVEGITTMQIKLIETDITGAKRVLASPQFAVEVGKSNTNEEGEELKTEFSAIDNFIAKANAAYESRLDRIELTNDCIFKAYYYDGSTYETDILKKLFYNGNVLLSESYAHGGTGTRIDEATDNSMYYSNVSKSEALNAKNIMENSEDVLEEVRKHGLYTAFSVDFNTGEVEYVTPSYKFKLNNETGELDAEGQSYTFMEEVYRVVDAWIEQHGSSLDELQAKAINHDKDILAHSEDISELQEAVKLTPISRGGTGATTREEALDNLRALSLERTDYVGDGNCGPEYKTIHTFDRKPKLIMLCDLEGGTNIIFPYGQTKVSFMRYARSYTSRNTEEYIYLSYDDLKISWYGQDGYGDSPQSQFNLKDRPYAIIGIG